MIVSEETTGVKNIRHREFNAGRHERKGLAMKQKLYLVTGANGHLASTIIRYLKKEQALVRGLIVPCEQNQDSENVTYYRGDITAPETLQEIFSGLEPYDVTVIHAAGLISIGNEVTAPLYQVNVDGTKNVIALCKKYAVRRLLYISSVHAISESDHFSVIKEVSSFPKEQVIGAYASTKAEATQAVMDAAKDGLDAIIVHPSGIIGPFDNGRNHITQFIQLYLSGKLPGGVTGGYDFVDVRDVALGCLSAAKKGKRGECYILSNRYITIKDLLEYMRIATNGKRKICFPLKIAQLLAPLFELFGRIKKKRPLFTRYSLYTMSANGRFSHDKATMELGYSPRDMKDTIRDTITYLQTGKALV